MGLEPTALNICTFLQKSIYNVGAKGGKVAGGVYPVQFQMNKL